MSRAYLKWTALEGQESTFYLPETDTLVGRKSDADVILADPYVSRHHAKVVARDEEFSIVDEGSTHGTYVNGSRVNDKVLENGDKITLGKSSIELNFLIEGQEPVVGVDRTLEKSLIDFTVVLPADIAGHSDLEKMSMLLDFQYNLGRNFSASATFEQILTSALKISGAERGFILFNKGDDFEFVVGRDGSRSVSEDDFRASQTAVRKVADSGEAVYMTEGIDGDLANQDSIVAMNLRALACLPLKWISADAADTGHVRGILYLDSTKVMHALSGLDQKILDKLSDEAANVFEKVEMIETLEEKRVFEQELSLARETQQTLLPPSLPEIPGFLVCAFSQPTRHVGGDFYDFFDTDAQDQLLGVLADVSGKGIAAALVSSLLQGALDMEFRTGMALPAALTRLNKFLCKRSQANRFVTLFLFKIEPDGSGEYISAGHNPAYLYRAATGEVEELVSENMILGAFDFVEYDSARLQLNDGDMLVIYSDGLTEAENPKGDMFEEERLIRLIKENASDGAPALEEKIVTAIQDFTKGYAQTDDITYMLVERV